jgi:hypothetical protein
MPSRALVLTISASIVEPNDRYGGEIGEPSVNPRHAAASAIDHLIA